MLNTNWQENATIDQKRHQVTARQTLGTNRREKQRKSKNKRGAVTKKDISQTTASMEGRQMNIKEPTRKGMDWLLNTEITEENILALIYGIEVM